jgi:DNA-binding beta-propeller fold protein YncE
MDADELLVFDVKKRRVLKRIPAPGVHGVLAVPQLGRVFASATDARQALTIDARTERVLARAPAGEYPDGLAYDPVERHVFVSDETGGAEIVLDAKGHRIGAVDVGGDAGNVQYDAGSRRILVDVQSRNDVAVIDRGRTGWSAACRWRAATTTTASTWIRRTGWRSLPATETQSC